VSFRLDPESYTATMILEDGREGAFLNLMPFFVAYNHATEASELDLEAEAAAERRAKLELEIIRMQKGLSPRGP
jgi:hypothetical protein